MGKRLIIKGASFITNAIDRITPATTYYSVTYNLNHCTATNNATSIAAGSTYTVTINPQSGYNISSVTVRHNGQTVMPTGSGYTYRINSVSGNITVTATATAVVTNYTVTYDLENATASNNATTVTAGSSYTVTLSPNSGYTISSATVTHNGMTVMPTGSGYSYTINSVSGNITVECVAVAQIVNYTVTYNLTNCTSNNNTTVVSQGSNYSFTLSPNSGYAMDSVTVTHNGVAVSPTSGYSYSISNVQGNIVVTASAVVQSITYHSTDVSWTNGAYINVLTNVPKSNSTYAYTDYINVEGFTTLTSVNHPAHAVAYYDANKNYVSGWVDDTVSSPVYAEEPHTTTIPSNISWIRCNSVQATNVSPLTNWSITISKN